MREEAAPAGFRLRRYERVDSTSDLCVQFAKQGEAGDLAVLATEQSAGRGTNGRGWESPSGNLFLSVLLRPRGPIAETTQFSLLAGLALVEALGGFLPTLGALSLKWPNDILLGGAKVGGVLIETATRGLAELAWLVVGFGANLASAPRVSGQATACLAETGIVPPSPIDVARVVLARLGSWRNIAASRGFAPVRAGWLRYGHPNGTPIVVRGAGGATHGSFAGIDADGALLLATEAGLLRCIAGRAEIAIGGLTCSS